MMVSDVIIHMAVSLVPMSMNVKRILAHLDLNALIIMVIMSVTILTSVHWLTRVVIMNIA